MRDEGYYLMEWLEFHKLVGVERFYLYNNNSVDNTTDIVIPYIQTGEVIFHDWPEHPGQIPAFEHCLQHYRQESEWMAFVDLDEFLFPSEKDDLREVLEEFKDYPAVVVNWLSFGSNGHIKRPQGLQMESYTKRAKNNFSAHKVIKSVIQPKKTIASGGTPHDFTYFEGYAVTENKEPVIGPHSKTSSVQKLRINHYKTRSKEDADYKTQRGRPTTLEPRNPKLFEAYDHNDVEDLTIQRFLPQVKQAIATRERILQYEIELKQACDSTANLGNLNLLEAASDKLKRSHSQLQRVKGELERSQSWLTGITEKLPVV